MWPNVAPTRCDPLKIALCGSIKTNPNVTSTQCDTMKKWLYDPDLCDPRIKDLLWPNVLVEDFFIKIREQNDLLEIEG